MGRFVVEASRSSLTTIWCIMYKVVFISLLLFTSCGKSNKSLTQFKKLCGTWIQETETGKFVESWNWVNDTLMSGTSFMTEGQDTVFSEDLKLTLRNDSIYYIPTVPNQNDGKHVEFKLIPSAKNEWIFENKKHDFPTQIIYTYKGNDSLIATVQGIQNGRSQKFEFRLKRN